MIQTLGKALGMNLAILNCAIKPGPTGSACEAGVCHAEMTRIPCDAYVVPHLNADTSKNRIVRDVARAGAQEGIYEFESHSRRTGSGGPEWEDVFVAESGGGRSDHLIHVVGIGSGEEDRERDSIEFIVFGALQAAAQEKFNSVVFPSLLIDGTGSLSAEMVARIMFKSIYHYWIMDEVLMPKHVLVAVEDEGTYLDFKSVIEGEAPFVEVDKASVEGEEPSNGDASKASMSPVGKLIDGLSPVVLTAFFLAVRRSGGSARERCKGLPCFERVKVLFTEKDGEELHPLAMQELERAFNELE